MKNVGLIDHGKVLLGGQLDGCRMARTFSLMKGVTCMGSFLSVNLSILRYFIRQRVCEMQGGSYHISLTIF